MIRVIGPRDRGYDRSTCRVINTTSRATGADAWSRGLSPFFLGPVKLYEGAGEARNVENAWQYAKVYKRHVGDDGNPTSDYFEWAREGWGCRRAVRYPMGKGAIPEYSWWDGERLTYVEARKRIYVPLYTRAVVRTKAFEKLYELHKELDELYLWDFDGYDHVALEMTLKEVLNDPKRKMGHAFVLAMLLEELDKR